jgi:hypothetical protein
MLNRCSKAATYVPSVNRESIGLRDLVGARVASDPVNAVWWTKMLGNTPMSTKVAIPCYGWVMAEAMAGSDHHWESWFLASEARCETDCPRIPDRSVVHGGL